MSNSVAKRAPEFEARETDWKLIRDFVAGEKSSKTHIDRLPGHSDETYEVFKQRAYFLGATERTVEGLCGLIFRKDPQQEFPTAFADYSADITREGKSAVQLASEICEEVLTTGICGVLIDHPPQAPGATLAQVEAQGIRPYARLYRAESILGIKEITRGASRVLQQVRLYETTKRDDPEDEFAEIDVERVRVLELDEAGDYQQRIFEKLKNKAGKVVWMEVDAFYPTMNGAKLRQIPFRVFTRRGHVTCPPKPPMLDLAGVNAAHLNDSALYQWGLMWTANPTPCFVELQLAEGETVTLGASQGLSFGTGGNAFFLEFSGAGLSQISGAMEHKRRDMATLGARMLMEDRKMVESAETARIHRSGENSILASISKSISEGMEWVFEMVGAWAGISGEFSCALNVDFVAQPMDPQSLTALMGAWQGGGLTKQDLFDALQRGEVIRDSKTFEEHEEALEDEMPMLPVVGGA